MHAIVIYALSWTPIVNSKAAEFYFMRLFFALVCAACETSAHKVISKAMNPRVALYFMLVLVSSAGMFHAAISYLPSSFAMYTNTVALSAFLDWTVGISTAQGLFWLSVGTIVGWPFVGALAVPYVVEELVMCYFTEDVIGSAARLFQGFCGGLVVLVVEGIVDYFFYHKMVIYPYQLAWYNIFGGSGKGPNIFGTEPWHYYIRNLLINFNLWFVLACAVWPLVFLQRWTTGQPASRLPFFRTLVTISPFYLWLAIFTLQPHKEERFMYPVYPFLALNAALALHIIVSIIDPSPVQVRTGPKVQIAGGKAPRTTTITGTTVLRNLKNLIIFSFLALTTTLNISRSLNLATSYSAPLSIYTALPPASSLSSSQPNLCLGKEWYRFPSSYHLPSGYRPKFIASDFHGLLPGAFSEVDSGFGFFAGAYLIPSGMNDENKEDLSKLIEEERCDFLVESWFPSEGVSELQPDRVHDEKKWEKVKCEKFLDQGSTGILGRLFWTPDAKWVPSVFRRQWGEYCLLERRP